MKDKHGDEVKLGDKVIGIDLNYTPPLYIGKITDITHYGAIIVKLQENIRNHPRFFSEARFYSEEFELWTLERELLVKLEI
jgi:hypothetical protein